MNGTTTREEARKSIQALLFDGKENTLIAPSNGNSHDEEGGFRRRFRADIQQALRRPPSAAKIAEQKAIESQVRRMLEGVQTSPDAEQEQEDQKDQEDEEDHDDEGEYPARRGYPHPGPPEQRSLTQKEEGSLADALRAQVADARKRLFNQDRKVSELTRELKLGRSQIWTNQQNLSIAESRVCKVIEEKASDFDPAVREEEKTLEKEERELARELGEARDGAARWSSVAKRQDTMLQQERESQRGSDAEGILRRHPAGEVFLTRFSRDESDDDSEDDRYQRARHTRQTSDRSEGISLGSDTSEDDARSPGGLSADARGVAKDCPPAPVQMHRGIAPPHLRMDDDDKSSEGSGSGSALPTPSSYGSSPVNSSTGGSPTKSSTGGSPTKQGQGTTPSAASLNGGVTPSGTSVKGGMRPDSDSDSDEEAGRPVQKKAAAPPLPELKGVGARGRAPPREEDEAEEVSSEEGLSTSRSV